MLYCALRGKTKEERGVTDYLSDSLQVGAPSPLFFRQPDSFVERQALHRLAISSQNQRRLSKEA
jgi:hypothetical protein